MKFLISRFTVAISGLVFLVSTSAIAEQNAATPCLQALQSQKGSAQSERKQEEKKPEEPGWFSRNAQNILKGVGEKAGSIVGKSLCDDNRNSSGCMAVGSAYGGLFGLYLGKQLSEADKKRYQEATYKVALTGRPQSIALDNGCALIEPKSKEVVYESRQIELALAPGVSAPEHLRSIGGSQVCKSPALVSTSPSKKGTGKLGANVPSFVMGSTNSGKTLLLGRDDLDQGVVGAGYVDAKGWVVSPGRTPQPAPALAAEGPLQLVMLGVEVPCRKVSSAIRVENSNTTETVEGKICTLPDGSTEAN